MARGRPVGSLIRQHIVDILFYLGKAYGYEIYKHYIEIFPKATLRVMYYHLKKGVSLNEFELERIAQIQGEYSWGGTAEKLIYELGNAAQPSSNPEVKTYFDALAKKEKNLKK